LRICFVGKSQSEGQLSWQDFVVFLRLSRQKLGWCLKLGLSCFPPHCFIVFNLRFGNHPIIWHHRTVYSGKSFVKVWLGCEGMVFSYHLYSYERACIGKLYLLLSSVWLLNLSCVTIFAMQPPMCSHLTILSLKRFCSNEAIDAVANEAALY